MRVLIIGGTGFLGRHLVQQGLERGHEITLFNRGKMVQGLFPVDSVRTITGDRKDDLHVLAGAGWDSVIDTCGYLPSVVGASARALRDCCQQYAFVSTLSVYAEGLQPGADESAALATIDDPETEVVDGRTYGALKVLCEQAVAEGFGANTLIVRPGLIVGPDDHTLRFAHWPAAVAHRRQVIAPPANSSVEFTDVRDLARWTWVAMESGLTGPYNVSGPTPPRATLDALLASCQKAATDPAEVMWATEEFLIEAGVAPWSDLPLWLPSGQDGSNRCSSQKAIDAGLTFRSIDDTVQATLAWAMANDHMEGTAGLTEAREAELIARWRSTGNE